MIIRRMEGGSCKTIVKSGKMDLPKMKGEQRNFKRWSKMVHTENNRKKPKENAEWKKISNSKIL